MSADLAGPKFGPQIFYPTPTPSKNGSQQILAKFGPLPPHKGKIGSIYSQQSPHQLQISRNTMLISILVSNETGANCKLYFTSCPFQ